MAVPVKRLERRLARSQVLIVSQQAVIIDLLARIDAPLCGSYPAGLSPVNLVHRADATGTSVSFSSLGREHGLVAPEFAGVLSETTDTLVFVKDFKRVWFQRGLSHTMCTRAQAVQALADVLAPLPRPWRFVGSSAGAWAALYFGAHLGADRIFAFSPQTLLDAATVRRFSGSDPETIGLDPDDPENDLASVLQAAPLIGWASIFYAQDNTMDCRHANRLVAVPRLTCHAMPGKSHHVAYRLRKSGRLCAVLNGEALS